MIAEEMSGKGKGKGKGHPKTSHKNPEGEWRCSYTLSLISALDENGGQRHAPAALPSTAGRSTVRSKA
jgi:hypothetical protein